MKFNIAASLISFVLVAFATFFTSIILSKCGIVVDDHFEALIVAFLIGFFILIYFRNVWFGYLINKAVKITLRSIRNAIGFDLFYNNFEQSKHDIVSDLKNAKKLKLFVQLGRGLVGGQYSLLYDEIRSKQNDSFSMLFLFAGIDSPWLSREVAKARKSNWFEWESEVNKNISNTGVFKSEGINIQARNHSEPFLWRLIFIDDLLYLMPYLYSKDNNIQAPVIKFKKSIDGNSSLYDVFEKYFDDVWERNNYNIIQNESVESTLRMNN